MMFSDHCNVTKILIFKDRAFFANNTKRTFIFQTAASVAWCFVQTAGADDEKREGTWIEVGI